MPVTEDIMGTCHLYAFSMEDGARRQDYAASGTYSNSVVPASLVLDRKRSLLYLQLPGNVLHVLDFATLQQRRQCTVAGTMEPLLIADRLWIVDTGTSNSVWKWYCMGDDPDQQPPTAGVPDWIALKTVDMAWDSWSQAPALANSSDSALPIYITNPWRYAKSENRFRPQPDRNIVLGSGLVVPAGQDELYCRAARDSFTIDPPQLPSRPCLMAVDPDSGQASWKVQGWGGDLPEGTYRGYTPVLAAVVPVIVDGLRVSAEVVVAVHQQASFKPQDHTLSDVLLPQPQEDGVTPYEAFCKELLDLDNVDEVDAKIASYYGMVDSRSIVCDVQANATQGLVVVNTSDVRAAGGTLLLAKGQKLAETLLNQPDPSSPTERVFHPVFRKSTRLQTRRLSPALPLRELFNLDETEEFDTSLPMMARFHSRHTDEESGDTVESFQVYINSYKYNTVTHAVDFNQMDTDTIPYCQGWSSAPPPEGTTFSIAYSACVVRKETVHQTFSALPEWDPYNAISDGSRIFFLPIEGMPNGTHHHTLACYEIQTLAPLWSYQFSEFDNTGLSASPVAVIHHGHLYVFLCSSLGPGRVYCFTLSFQSGDPVQPLAQIQVPDSTNWQTAQFIADGAGLHLAGDTGVYLIS